MRPNHACNRAPQITGHQIAAVNQLGSNPRASSGAASRPEAVAAALWTKFWQEFGSEARPQDRCFVPPAGRDRVDQHWTHFADTLAQGAHAIDLGCGGGIVGRLLTSRRPHLSVTGVDLANIPAPVLPGVAFHMGARMEALPFSDESFDAAVSLFGIEYGDIGKIACELARVLRRGARFSFLIHHRGSETLREGVGRRQELQAILAGKLKRAFLAGSASGVAELQSRIASQYAPGATATLIGGHCLRNIARARSEREAIWDHVEANLAPEIALLRCLDRSAKSAAELTAWLSALVSVMQLTSVSVLPGDAGDPVAWIVSGRR